MCNVIYDRNDQQRDVVVEGKLTVYFDEPFWVGVFERCDNGKLSVTILSFVLSIIAVLFLTAARLPYAVTVVFFLLVIKGILVFKAHSV